MTYAAEAAKTGRRPISVVEVDLDYCSYHHPNEQGLDQLLKSTELLDSWYSFRATAEENGTPVSPGKKRFKVTDLATSGSAYIGVAVPSGRLTDNLQYTLSVKLEEGDATTMTLALYDSVAPAFRAQIDYEWVAGSLTVKAEDVGTGSVTDLGGGVWLAEAVVPAMTIVAANAHSFLLCPTEYGVLPGASVYTYMQSPMLNLGTSAETYQPVCGATASVGEECYQTRFTCQDTASYDGGGSNILTCRWCEAKASSKEQVEMAAIPCVRSAQVAPARMEIGAGLGQRATVTVTLQDFPHHDRGIDPYVSTRTYTPKTQGTYFGKLRARNPYYQGRPLRVKVGYVTDPIDLTNNFKTHNYVIERIEGPDYKGAVTITAQDVLKLVDDERAQAPASCDGVLDANINDAAMSFNLLPAGVGNSDYSASGTLRIGSECMTFTRIADAITVVARGTDGTTAVAHDADDSVQECLRYTDETLDVVLYDLIVTKGGVDSSYVDTAAWDTEVTDWLSGHAVTALITEPTGVCSLVNELCKQFLAALWWDDIDQEIDIKVLAPSTLTFDELTDDSHLVADSVRVTDDSSKRLSQVWVYYDIIDPTGDLEEARNYRVLYIYDDADAEGATQYGETRVEKFYCRWFTSAADALRLGARTLMRFRDNPRRIRFALSAADEYQPGDVVKLTTSALQDETGADVTTKVEIVDAQDLMPGHTRQYESEDYAFEGRYFIFAPDATPNYSAASDEEKELYGFICPDTGEFTDGTDGYKIV